MSIIGISGKIGSGKDTIGKIIQYLTSEHGINNTRSFEAFSKISNKDGSASLDFHRYTSYWEIKKFADKLKDIVCLLIGCTREQLEDINFKNSPLGKEWKVFRYVDDEGKIHLRTPDCIITEDLAEYLTPRKILQLLGTECLRDIIHPNVHINALFADYNDESNYSYNVALTNETNKLLVTSDPVYYKDPNQSNWLITDVRFPNEGDAIINRNGILIRVNRTNNPFLHEGKEIKSDKSYSGVDTRQHHSETALDNYDKFKYTINNDGTIEDLIEKVKEILIKEEII
jgi:hypothetical protein